MNPSPFVTLTVLGELYGVGARDVGAWLKSLGLRQPTGWPSREAVLRGFTLERPLACGVSFWLWHRARVCHELDMMGYPRGGSLAKIEEFDGFRLIRSGK